MPRLSDAPSWVRVSLLVVAFFNLLSAIAGGYGLISGGIVTMGLPLSLLDGSPFSNYFWPGVILLVVVGGTQALAIVAQFRRAALYAGLHAVAGFGMIIWIFVELVYIDFSVLHAIYFGAGLLQCILVMLAIGVWPVPFLGRTGAPGRPGSSAGA